jgi:hypothetical protein
MALQQLELRKQRGNPSNVSLPLQPPAWPRKATGAGTEDVLRDLAFVYHLTRSVKTAIIGEPALPR